MDCSRTRWSFNILRTLIVLSILFLVGTHPSVVNAQEDEFVAIKAKKIITVSGEEIDGGVIVVRNGKIDAVGPKVEIPWGAKIVDASDQVVMPGLVNPRTRVSLRPYTRSGIRANLTVDRELYPDPNDFKSVLHAGFTTVGLYPAGRGFPGQTLAVQPTSGDLATIKVKGNCYLPAVMTSPASDKKIFLDAFKQAQAEIDKVEKARKAWDEKQKKAAAEAKKKAEEEKKKAKPGESPPPNPQPKPKPKSFAGDEKKPEAKKEEPKKEEFKPPRMNPAYVPLVELIQKKEGVQLLIELNSAGDLVHLIDAQKRGKIDVASKLFVDNRRGFSSFMSSGVDLALMIEELTKQKAFVLLRPTLNNFQMTTNRFNLPADLDRGGCTIAFTSLSDRGADFSNFFAQVTGLIRAGLSRETALKAMTLHAAEVLGMGDQIGSIEKDKAANFVFLSHDPFDAETRVTRVMIGGKTVAEPKLPRNEP